MNPYDEFARRSAASEGENSGTVTAVTVGGDTAKEVLRTALALQVDKRIFHQSRQR